MRFVSWLVGLPLAVVVVVFALSNRQTMAVALWPFDSGLVLPIYLAVLLPLLVGFLLGFLTAGMRGLRHRRAARLHARRAAALERQLDSVRSEAAPMPSTELSPPTEKNPPTP